MIHRVLGIFILTLVEVTTLVGWLILAGLKFDTVGAHSFLAIIFLYVGLFVEHYVGINIAVGRGIFGIADKGVPRAV